MKRKRLSARKSEGEVQSVGNLLHFHNKCIAYHVVFVDGVIQPIDIYQPQGKNGQEYRFHFKCLKFELTCKFKPRHAWNMIYRLSLGILNSGAYDADINYNLHEESEGLYHTLLWLPTRFLFKSITYY